MLQGHTMKESLRMLLFKILNNGIYIQNAMNTQEFRRAILPLAEIDR